jgi:anti-anti-sigma factor
MTIGPASVEEKNAQVRKLRVPAEEGQLSKVRDFIAECCEEAAFSARETNNTKLAVDEACTNVIKHAYKDTVGDIEILVTIKQGDVSVAIRDTGTRFDFAGVKDPDLDQYVETGRKGGLGVFLINRLMDDVQYRAGAVGNELIMRKSSHAAISRALPGKIAWRGTLRYKFTLRASLGLLALIVAIWGFVFARQTRTIHEQQTTEWLAKKTLAETVAERSKAYLIVPEQYSVEQTSLTTYVTRILEGNEELAYVRIVDNKGDILSSGNVDEIFTRYQPPAEAREIGRDDAVVWTRFEDGDRAIRNIECPVRVRNNDSAELMTLGHVQLGVWQDALEASIADPRFVTTLILLAFFLVGVLLIAGLVSVFVKPIQVLTDGVRAIGQGSLDGKISVDGPAEIGAIASVFNEITEKFKKAQEGVLEREKLQKEIEVAKQIQQTLLPKKHPDISGYDIAPYYQAAKEVGGDYYDFVQVDEDTLGVVVADVSGKGVPGSLVMTMIRTALRMEARGNKNASDVMAKMNDFVTDDMKKGMFVTMFYVILDSTNRIISYASAGHNPMILYRAESNETFFLNPKGFPVGISLPDETLFRKSISLEKIKLKKDDMLVIYTDGVTEAMNERREQYGEERLIAALKKFGHLHPAEFIESLERDIKSFTGGEPQNDDITVVAIKEKLAADDVLFGIRKRLIDMVDLQGISVKEACTAMKVSPSTYYKYKKRLELMGDRGLKNKVLRQELDLKRVSIEDRKRMIGVIKGDPELGAKRITEELNRDQELSRYLSVKMVYDELRRLGLNTRELRIEYLRRHKLWEEDQPGARKKSREMVEDLLAEVASRRPADETAPAEPGFSDAADELAELNELDLDALDFGADETAPPPRERIAVGGVDALVEDEETEVIGDLELSVVRGADNVTILRIDGHLDSVSTGSLERKLDEVVAKGDRNIVVDLSRVSYISSGGWGIMVGEVKRLREGGGDVVLVGMMSEVYDVYELLGFADILKALPDAEAARGFFRKTPLERSAEASRPAAGAETAPETADAVRPFAGVVKTGTYEAEWDSLRIEAGTVGEKGDVAVLSLAGIVDTVSAENLRQAIDRVIKAGICKIVVDMSLVEYVSSGGWGTFTERLREVRRKGGDVKVFGMDPDVYYVFTMLGFNIVLSSFDILTEAIEDFKRAAGEKPSRHPSTRAAAGASAAGTIAGTAPPESAPPVAAPSEAPRRETARSEAPPRETAPLESARYETAAAAPGPEAPSAGTGRRAPEAERPSAEPEKRAAKAKPSPEASPERAKAPRVLPAIRRQDEWAQWSESDGVLVGAIEGPIEAVAVEKLEREIEARLESKPVFVLLDLGGVDYISSTGWGLIAKYRDDVRKWGGSMTLCRMRPELYEIFCLLELNSIIEAYATIEDALGAFHDSGGRTSMRKPQKPGGAGPAAAAAAEAAATPATPETAETETLRRAGDEAAIDEILIPGPPAAPLSGPETDRRAGEITTGRTRDRLASTWRTEDLDILDDAEDIDASAVSSSGDADAAGSGEAPRLDTGSAVDDERLAEDKKIRDLGWAQYGERLKKTRKQSPPDANEEDLS